MDGKIKEAIEKLKALDLNGSSLENLSAICSVLYQPEHWWTIGECMALRDVLVGMLEQLDPDEWSNEYLDEVGMMRLPKDVNDEVIRIGDELCWNGRPDGGMYCKATNGRLVYVGEADECSPKQWMTWSAVQCCHYHKPTVRETLSEVLIGFGTRWDEMDAGSARELADEYADAILRIVEASND